MNNDNLILPDPSTMTEEAKKEEIATLSERLKALRATPRSDWHRIFERILREEARPYGSDVEIRVEQELGIDPPRVDYLILDDMKHLMRGKEIFSIFRQHNIVEYKNPDDKLNSRVISKIIGYANFYIGLAEHEHDRPRNEVSISIFRSGRNPGLFKKMIQAGTLVRTETPGIYLVQKLTDLPFQIVITGELVGDEYAAYRVLTKHAQKEDVKTIANAGVNDPDLKDLCTKLLEFIDTKNPSLIDEIKGGETKMGRTLMDIMKPEIDNVRRNDLFDYVYDGDMPLERGAKRAGLTPEQFRIEMEKYKASQKETQTV